MALISICQIFFTFSILGIFIIFFRNLPLLVEFEPPSIPKEKRIYFRFKTKVLNIKNKTLEIFHRLKERSLHRLRVLTLKIDNLITSSLKKTRDTKTKEGKNHFSVKEEKLKSPKKSKEDAKKY